jgi:MFS family permease
LYDFILSGRLINGIGCGLSTTLGPMFLTEISPIQYRGIFGTSNQFGVVLSILIAWIISLPELYITAEGAFNQYTLILGH